MHKQTNFYDNDPSVRQLFSTGASHLMFRLKQASALLKLKKPKLTVVPGVGVEEVFINGTGKKMVTSMACYSTTEVECNRSFNMQNGAACALILFLREENHLSQFDLSSFWPIYCAERK